MSDSGELFDVLRERRSVRRFRPEPVDRGLVLSLVEAASLAPSSHNRQDGEFAIACGPAVVARMAAIVRTKWESLAARRGGGGAVAEALAASVGHFDWFGEAPAVIAVSVKRPESFLVALAGERARAVSGAFASAAMAAQNLMLAAHAHGLGSCCLTGALIAEEELKELLGVGTRRELVCLIALGYPAERPSMPPRKPAAAIARFID